MGYGSTPIFDSKHLLVNIIGKIQFCVFVLLASILGNKKQMRIWAAQGGSEGLPHEHRHELPCALNKLFPAQRWQTDCCLPVLLSGCTPSRTVQAIRFRVHLRPASEQRPCCGLSWLSKAQWYWGGIMLLAQFCLQKSWEGMKKVLQHKGTATFEGTGTAAHCRKVSASCCMTLGMCTVVLQSSVCPFL